MEDFRRADTVDGNNLKSSDNSRINEVMNFEYLLLLFKHNSLLSLYT